MRTGSANLLQTRWHGKQWLTWLQGTVGDGKKIVWVDERQSREDPFLQGRCQVGVLALNWAKGDCSYMVIIMPRTPMQKTTFGPKADNLFRRLCSGSHPGKARQYEGRVNQKALKGTWKALWTLAEHVVVEQTCSRSSKHPVTDALGSQDSKDFCEHFGCKGNPQMVVLKIGRASSLQQCAHESWCRGILDICTQASF